MFGHFSNVCFDSVECLATESTPVMSGQGSIALDVEDNSTSVVCVCGGGEILLLEQIQSNSY